MLKKAYDISNLRCGISILHAWIRFFETVLHIADKLPIKKYQARTLAEKRSVEERKKEIQKQFRERMGLVVDQPRTGGSGTSNDGNSARRVFQNSNVASEILQIDRTLLEKLHVILITISCNFDIDSEKFKSHCIQTARYYTQHYKWYPMPQSVHKILLHGHAIIEVCSLPLGMYSEEAQEASNKYFKKYKYVYR